jgi:hypothetical protein
MMMPPMHKVFALLALASAIFHLATIGVIMDMRIELSTVRDMLAGLFGGLIAI